jgi:hypothetical protein
MLLFDANFWQQFWTVIGGGAALTVMLSLVIAAVPPRRPQRRQPVTPLPLPRPDAPERLVAAGR